MNYRDTGVTKKEGKKNQIKLVKLMCCFYNFIRFPKPGAAHTLHSGSQ